jgi:hypothetical protein
VDLPMTSPTPDPIAGERSMLLAVAMPTEHGGWGLTLEPVLLGLLIAPSWSGVALGAAALVAFVARTPMKVALVDRWRHRRLPRTVLAERVAAVELTLLAGLVAVAFATAHDAFWIPIVIALPLVVVELWFDMRSRSRRLLPELAGAIGIGGVAAAIVLADGGEHALAAALWCIVAARAISSIPFVRLQLCRFKHQPYRRLTSDAAQGVAVVVAAGAVALDPRLVAGLVAIIALVLLQVWASHRPPPVAAVLGAQQVVAGLTVVLVTALGALAP